MCCSVQCIIHTLQKELIDAAAICAFLFNTSINKHLNYIYLILNGTIPTISATDNVITFAIVTAILVKLTIMHSLNPATSTSETSTLDQDIMLYLQSHTNIKGRENG
jgi:hypothetical protein